MRQGSLISRRAIRAQQSEDTIRVYQAYNNAIADSALTHGKFVAPPFKMQRMSWIKPSFLWMMYRASWGYKDENQQRVLGIDITHEGFLWALDHSCLSTNKYKLFETEELFKAELAAQPVRIQWDPERDIYLEALPHRAIQIGLSSHALHQYVNDWTVKIEDVTQLAHKIKNLVDNDDIDKACTLLPDESEYVLPSNIATKIAASE